MTKSAVVNRNSMLRLNYSINIIKLYSLLCYKIKKKNVRLAFDIIIHYNYFVSEAIINYYDI